MQSETTNDQIERWGTFELVLEGSRDGNPFLEVELSTQFRQGHRPVDVKGFYDGEGVYRVRFMPDTEGLWSFVTTSNRSELDGITGRFACVPECVKSRETDLVGIKGASDWFDAARSTPSAA